MTRRCTAPSGRAGPGGIPPARIRAGLRAPRSESHGPKALRRHRPRSTALAEARERVAAGSVECPDAQPLELPHRRYYLWTGPLRSVTALRDMWEDPPSLVWP